MSRDETLLVLGIVVVMGGIVYIYVGFREYIMQIYLTGNTCHITLFNDSWFAGLEIHKIMNNKDMNVYSNKNSKLLLFLQFYFYPRLKIALMKYLTKTINGRFLKDLYSIGFVPQIIIHLNSMFFLRSYKSSKSQLLYG